MEDFGRARVGTTSLEISRVGLGGGALGHMYEDVPDEVAVATVRRAIDSGMTHVDTAPLYGRGESERRIGAALKGIKRNVYTIATKVGRILVPYSGSAPWQGAPPVEAEFDFTREGILKSFAESKKRLQLDSVDILLIHDCDNYIAQAVRESQPAVAKLKERGSTKAIGAGLNSYETALRLAKKAEFDCFLIAGRYTLLEQGALKEFIPFCEDREIGIIIGGPFNSGILASDLKSGLMYNYQAAPAELVEKARKIKVVCDKYSVPLRAAALQFILANPAITSVIPGNRSPAEVEDNAKSLKTMIPGGVWDELKASRLIEETSPTPR